jgi:putative ATP-dependent endonuclease of the OLD family
LEIKSLSVRNFRGIRTAALADLGRYNVLIGKNNAGKSTVMRALVLALNAVSTEFAGVVPTSTTVDEEFSDKDPSVPIQFGIGVGVTSEETNVVLENFEYAEGSGAADFANALKQERQLYFAIKCWKKGNHIASCLMEIWVGRNQNDIGRLGTRGMRLFALSDDAATNISTLQDAIVSASGNIKAADYAETNRASLNTDFNNYFFKADTALGRDAGNMIRNWYNEAKNIAEFSKTLIAKRGEFTTIRGRLTGERNQILAAAINERIDFRTLHKAVDLVSRLKKKVFGERKQPLDEKDAKLLVALKTGRHDKERWQRVKTITKALLDVDLEAYGGDGRPAELEIGDFLPDATGAGIKESLRIIFDLENQKSDITLIEEPEVHLHPALARAMSNYLRQKSNEVQIFLTSHSTEFVDAATFQNVYLVSRNTRKQTELQLLDTSTGLQAVPAELGLRPSTLFMHDSLVFVEGPSDEEVLREFANKLGLDLAKANVGFIRLGGITNLKSYAAEEVITLLSRRQVKLWFVVDRDERDSMDIQRMKERLGDRANLCVLERRELENYLLDARAVRKFLELKKMTSQDRAVPSLEDLSAAMQNVSLELKEEAISLRLKKRLLTPVYPNTKEQEQTPIVDQLNHAKQELDKRLQQVQAQKQAVEAEVDANWNERSMDVAPGTQILDKTCSRYGVRFDKGRGDSLRLAELISADSIADWISGTLREITK